MVQFDSRGEPDSTHGEYIDLWYPIREYECGQGREKPTLKLLLGILVEKTIRAFLKSFLDIYIYIYYNDYHKY